MSFDMDIQKILQYAYNVFASVNPVLYLYVGAAFGAFLIGKLLHIMRG